jgi:hypothetical protein
VDIAGILPYGVVQQVIDQFDHRRLAGHLFEVADILCDALDQGELFESFVIDDVVDHEDVGRRQIGLKRGLDILARGADDSDPAPADPLDLVDEEDIRGLIDCHGQDIMHLEQRQNDVGFEELAREQLHRLGVAELRTDLGIGNTVGLGQGRGDLVLRTVAHLDEELAEQLAMAFVLLFGQSMVDLLLSDHTSRQQELTELHLVLKQNLAHTIPLFAPRQTCSGEAPDGLGKFRMTVKFRLQACDLEDLLDRFVEPRQLELCAAAAAVLPPPHQQFQPLTVDGAGVAHVDDNPLAAEGYRLDDGVLQNIRDIAVDFALEFDHSDIVVVLRMDLHRSKVPTAAVP